MRSISAGIPYRCTGIIAFVREVIAASRLSGIQRSADRVNIDEHRRGADVTNGPCGCYERHRDRYDFVSWTDIETAQSQMQRARAAVQADTMINSAVRCEFRPRTLTLLVPERSSSTHKSPPTRSTLRCAEADTALEDPNTVHFPFQSDLI